MLVFCSIRPSVHFSLALKFDNEIDKRGSDNYRTVFTATEGRHLCLVVFREWNMKNVDDEGDENFGMDDL